MVRSIIRRVRNRFNLSVAEVGGQDTWQRALLGLSAAGGDATTVRRVLDRAVAFIEDLHLAEVVSSDIEVLDLPYRDGEDGGDRDGEDVDQDGAGSETRTGRGAEATDLEE